MKILILIIVIIMLAFAAFAQKQYIVDSAGATNLALMKVKFRDVVDTTFYSDGSHAYIIESNFPGASMPHTQIGMLTYQHPLNIKATAAQKKQIAAYIKSVLEPPSIPNAVKLDGDSAVFSAGWTHGPTTAAGWYKNTIAYSATPGATVTYSFTGTGIEVYAETKSTHGTGTVTLLRGTEVIETKPTNFVSTETILPAKIYEKKGLPSGTYTIRLTVGTGYSLLDFFNIYK